MIRPRVLEKKCPTLEDFAACFARRVRVRIQLKALSESFAALVAAEAHVPLMDDFVVTPQVRANVENAAAQWTSGRHGRRHLKSIRRRAVS